MLPFGVAFLCKAPWQLWRAILLPCGLTLQIGVLLNMSPVLSMILQPKKQTIRVHVDIGQQHVSG